MTNCILWGNNAAVSSEIDGEATLRHCIIAGGWAGPGFGNLDDDPLFVDVVGNDGIFGTVDDDFGLRVHSPGIDRGLNLAVPRDVIFDLAGARRFLDDPGTPDGIGTPPIVDIGAFEFTGRSQP